MIDYFLKKYCREMNKEKKSLSTSARRLLLNYQYPGNVRELGNIIEYAVALSIHQEIDKDDLPHYVQEQKKTAFTCSDNNDDIIHIPLGLPMKEIEKRVIGETLRYYGNHRQKTAQILQISERSLRDKIKQYEINNI
uniref:helix-turn-helix domain-containing protein n=1 Tax=Heyndrickxia sporothermodurans TaxID=46224 RepID=UPI0028934AB7|nr:helix-turn-helix domain-containing protein [Heyndrickxia sporothermodurans]